jgi:hypothetical protein
MFVQVCSAAQGLEAFDYTFWVLDHIVIMACYCQRPLYISCSEVHLVIGAVHFPELDAPPPLSHWSVSAITIHSPLANRLGCFVYSDQICVVLCGGPYFCNTFSWLCKAVFCEMYAPLKVSFCFRTVIVPNSIYVTNTERLLEVRV